MRLSDGVEWAVHSVTLLAHLPPGTALPASRLAEFHEVPPAYLAKHLQSLGRAGVLESVPGPHGGFRLARPPDEITLLDVVQAIDGHSPAFRCAEIRRNGPSAVAPADAYRGACGIAAAMWRAEDAWRRELASVSIADLNQEAFETVPPAQLAAGAEWLVEVTIDRRKHP